MRGQRRRQTFHLQRDERAGSAGRRGDHSRALLGELPGHREVCGRNARLRGDEAGRGLQREGFDDRKSRHSTDKVAHSKLADQYERILAVCKRHNVWLMGDECYSHFTYEPHKPYSIASAARSMEHVIIIGSVSKTFAMTGWRIGYTLGLEALIQALIKLQSQSTSN